MAEQRSVQDWIRREAAKQGVPPELALAVAEAESNFDPTAIGKLPADAQGTRAIGTFQLLPATAQRMGVDPHDPLGNIRGGTAYLKELLDQHPGDLDRVLAVYGGVKNNTTYVPNVKGRMAKFRQLPASPAETLPGIAAPPPPPPSPGKSGLRVGIEGFNDLAMGALKGAGSTATNLGELVHKIPGVRAGVDALYGAPVSEPAFAQAHKVLEPSNTTQSVGKFGEQIGELFLPSGAIKAASAGRPILQRMAIEGVAGGGLSAAQGGDPLTGGALSAAIPVVGKAAGATSKYLNRTAGKKVAQALGATKEKYKAITARITPEILKRGLGGSREKLIEQSSGALDEASNTLTSLSQQYGPDRIGTREVIDALEDAKDEFRTVKTPWGGQQPGQPPTIVEHEPRPIRQLEKLQTILRRLGRSATVAQITAIRRAWDDVVARAGGFAHRAEGAIGIPLAEQTEAWAKREATSAIREKLSQRYPDLADINKEWSFWMNLKDVLTQTVNRQQPQGPGLGRTLATTGVRLGGTLAALSQGSGPVGALSTGYVAGQVFKALDAAITSPRWQLASARVRHGIAEALAAGNWDDALRWIGQVGAVEGSKVGEPPPRQSDLRPGEYGPPAPPDL